MKTKHIVLSSKTGISAAVATRLAAAVTEMHSVVILKCDEQLACTKYPQRPGALCCGRNRGGSSDLR